MEEFIQILMSNYTINQDNRLELTLVKMIELWDLSELETLLNTNKGV